MKSLLGQSVLRTDDVLRVSVVTPPAQEEGEAILQFYSHKSEEVLRDIRARLLGKYASVCHDRYLVGELDGRIVGGLWYGYGSLGTRVGNFGHVYTDPSYRGRGISGELLRFFKEDFAASDARVVLCIAYRQEIADIYIRRGFVPALAGMTAGPLAYVRPGSLSYEDMVAEYFAPRQTVRVVPATQAHRHDADLLLMFELQARGHTPRDLSMVESFRNALFHAEDGQGVAMTILGNENHVLGWVFFPNTCLANETGSPVFDRVLHPDFHDLAADVTIQAYRLARSQINGSLRDTSEQDQIGGEK